MMTPDAPVIISHFLANRARASIMLQLLELVLELLELLVLVLELLELLELVLELLALLELVLELLELLQLLELVLELVPELLCPNKYLQNIESHKLATAGCDENNGVPNPTMTGSYLQVKGKVVQLFTDQNVYRI